MSRGGADGDICASFPSPPPPHHHYGDICASHEPASRRCEIPPSCFSAPFDTEQDECGGCNAQVLPYDFQGARRPRRSVAGILDDLYHYKDAADDEGAIMVQAAHPQFPDGESGEESREASGGSKGRLAGGNKQAEADLRGGVPTRTQAPARKAASPVRPQSALPARKRPPQPMSLSSSAPKRGANSNRPASALARYSADFSFGAGALGPAADQSVREVDAAASSGNKLKKGVAGGGGFGGEGFVKGRPASALAHAHERWQMESEEGHGRTEREQGPAASRDRSLRSSKELTGPASIYHLMRHAADPTAKARAREVERFLERAQHDTVALPARAHGAPRQGGTGSEDLALRGSEVARVSPPRRGMSEGALEAVRARSAGQRPRVLGRLIQTPDLAGATPEKEAGV
jgi:hypothetical protein